MVKVRIFSGVFVATSSMSMPPSVEPTKAMRRNCGREKREIEFLGDVGAVLDIEAVDRLPRGAGLQGDERVAEHLLRFLGRPPRPIGEAHAALRAGGRPP